METGGAKDANGGRGGSGATGGEGGSQGGGGGWQNNAFPTKYTNQIGSQLVQQMFTQFLGIVNKVKGKDGKGKTKGGDESAETSREKDSKGNP